MANAAFQLLVVCWFAFISLRYSLGTVRSENNDETIYELASMLTSAKINIEAEVSFLKDVVERPGFTHQVD